VAPAGGATSPGTSLEQERETDPVEAPDGKPAIADGCGKPSARMPSSPPADAPKSGGATLVVRPTLAGLVASAASYGKSTITDETRRQHEREFAKFSGIRISGWR
jgi:hypothetical protein